MSSNSPTQLADLSVALPGMVVPKQDRSRRTREKIIEAAIDLFEKRGFEKTTSNDIAAAAGVSIGSFYVYFTDKRQLLLLIFERLVTERLEAVFNKFVAEDILRSNPREMIREAIVQTFCNKRETPGLNRVICEMASKDEEVSSIRQRLHASSIERLREIYALAQQGGLTNDIDVQAAAEVTVHAVDALAWHYVLMEKRPDCQCERIVNTLTDMIYRHVFKTI